jgi:hypothetical protein
VLLEWGKRICGIIRRNSLYKGCAMKLSIENTRLRWSRNVKRGVFAGQNESGAMSV